jgi:hypothetical protein
VAYDTGGRSATFSYLVPAAGTYYVAVVFNSESVSYTIQVTTTGTPQLQPLPAQAGCLAGVVDYITYSLDFIPICRTRSRSVQKLEKALTSGLPVQACYGGNGNIFQITLQNPTGVSAASRSKR